MDPKPTSTQQYARLKKDRGRSISAWRKAQEGGLLADQEHVDCTEVKVVEEG